MSNKIEYNFVLLKSKAKQPYHWVCKAANGQVKFHSENYAQKGSCIYSIRKLCKVINVSWNQIDATGDKPGISVWERKYESK